MTRVVVLAGLALLACGGAPAFAQNNSELLGAPGYQAAQEQAAKRAAARKKVEDQIAQARARTKRQADEAAAAAAKQAGDRKAEEARLAKQAELEALEARLRTREQELAAEEERLAQLRAEVEAGEESADASAGAPELPLAGAEADEAPVDDRPAFVRLDASIESCAFAGEDKALSRDYVSARYVRPPRFYERSRFSDGVWELRGVMRVEDWRGAILADTVCELDRDGRVQYFAFLR